MAPRAAASGPFLMEGSGVGLRTDAGERIVAAAGWAAPAWALGASQQEPQREGGSGECAPARLEEMVSVPWYLKDSTPTCTPGAF